MSTPLDAKLPPAQQEDFRRGLDSSVAHATQIPGQTASVGRSHTATVVSSLRDESRVFPNGTMAKFGWRNPKTHHAKLKCGRAAKPQTNRW